MSNHTQTYASVFPIIKNEQEDILIHLRQHTGYMDGLWDLAGTGHIDQDELPIEALIRECQEELGIEVAADDVRFAHVSYRSEILPGPTYNYYYFFVDKFKGQPYIKEPYKNAALKWVSLDQLPLDMIKDRKESIQQAFAGQTFSQWRQTVD